MKKTRGTAYLLAGLALLFLVLYVAQATWLVTPPATRKYIAQPGETLGDIADRYGVHAQEILRASGLRVGMPVTAGQILTIPLPALAPLRQWKVQWAGVLGTLLGVLAGLGLAHFSGLLRKGTRGLIIVLAAVLAIMNYASVQVANAQLQAAVTPAFVFAAATGGFAWSTFLPLLLAASGLS
jgi:LysM repeat protein